VLSPGLLFAAPPTLAVEACSGGTYVGPYTSLGWNVVLRSVEIENSVVMDCARLEDAGRIVDGLVGAETVVAASDGLPMGHCFVVGEKAVIKHKALD